MRVTDLEITVNRREPDPNPKRDALQSLTGSGSVKVVVRTDAGVSGTGDVGFGRVAGAPDALGAVIEHELKRLVVGSEVARVRGTHEAMLRETEYHGSFGLAMFGIAAIDVALWDCLGKAHGVPCWQLWGAVRDRIPAYAMVGWLNYSDDEVQRVCAEAVEHGFRAVKLQVGYPTMQEAVKRVEVVRRAVGDEVRIMVDANGALSRAEAIRQGRAFEELGCFWFEEPITAQDIDGYVEIADALEIPVTGGENIYGRRRFAQFLSRGALDVVQPTMRRAGGPTALLQIGTMAHAFGRSYCSAQTDGTVQLNVMACLPNALYLQADVLQPLSLPGLTDGHVPLPTGPGFDWE